MSSRHQPAAPVEPGPDQYLGVTKREAAATEIMAGMMSGLGVPDMDAISRRALLSVKAADALFDALEGKR